MIGGVHMYLKRILMICSFLMMTFCFSLSAYAAPDENADTFFNTFEMDEEELVENVVDGNLGLYTVSKDGASTLQKTDNSFNDYKVLVLNNGYSKLSVVTFSTTKILSGKGDENTIVGINVFNVKEDSISNSKTDMQTIGASGIYNGTINLKVGDNHVVIAVKNGDTILYRLFKVTVKQEETKGALENMQIIFMQTDKSNTNDKLNEGSIIKQVIGVPVVDSLTK